MSKTESNRALREAPPESYTFEGVRLLQSLEFRALPLSEKLRAAASMSDLVRYFQERRRIHGPLRPAATTTEDARASEPGDPPGQA